MTRRRLAALCGRELRMLRGNWALLIVYLALPIAVAAFTKQAFDTIDSLRGRGSGAEQAVAGQATMFSVMLLSQLGYSFFEEHAWRTWDRLRASAFPVREVVLAKLGVSWLHQSLQLLVLFAVGWSAFGLHVRASAVAGLVAVGLSFTAALVALGLVLIAVSRSNAQFNVACYLGALVLAGCGGALVPFALLPAWARAVGPVTPTYWAMTGFDRALAGGATGSVLGACAALWAIGAVAAVAGSLLFRPARRLQAYA